MKVAGNQQRGRGPHILDNPHLGWTRATHKRKSNWRNPPCCVECGKVDASYKCPNCRRKYCSLGCCKAHKERCISLAAPGLSVESSVLDLVPKGDDADGGVVKRTYTYEFPTDDTIPFNKLLEIKDDERIRELLKSRNLRRLITDLDDMPNPTQTFRSVMDNDEFRAFSNAVLEIVGLKNDYNL